METTAMDEDARLLERYIASCSNWGRVSDRGQHLEQAPMLTIGEYGRGHAGGLMRQQDLGG